jgi:hypothetical protein
VSSTIQGRELNHGAMMLLIKIRIINSHSRTSCLWARFKLEGEEIVINGLHLSSFKFQTTVLIGLGPRVNPRSILQTQIGTP